jgi:hypothetical protein
LVVTRIHWSRLLVLISSPIGCGQNLGGEPRHSGINELRVKKSSMSASSAITGVSSELGIGLNYNTPELAAAYDRTSLYQFENGKQLVSVRDMSDGESVSDIGPGTGQLAA